MLEFTNLIRVEPLSSENKVYELMANTFSYIPQSSDNDSGNYWNCDKTIVIDLPDAATRKFFSIERNSIVTIKASDGRSFSIGTKEVPARVQISSNLTSANLIIKCKMLKDPLL